ncbi:MAG: hypothetical protein KC636_34425 [Myxococcales bacterium]|nr:hypothetical protein [Myxococcales bacterium]
MRIVFGVGDEPLAAPHEDRFAPVYTVQMPVARLGGLDADDVFEFDAGGQLELLQRRAVDRRWALRVELAVDLSREASIAADLEIEAPFHAPATVEGLRVLERRPGAAHGRLVEVVTHLAHSPEAALRLAGDYVFRCVDGERVVSDALVVRVGLSEFEFE